MAMLIRRSKTIITGQPLTKTSATSSSKNKYRNVHLWMIIPMIVMQLGIYQDYWGDFSDNAWSVHIHYWTGSVWYFYLIIQPYFATHGQIARHRTNGIIGMFVAGGVCLTALSMMHRDIVSTQKSLADPQAFGPFQPWFFFGVTIIEIVMMTAFGYAVLKSILHRKELENHSWWLMSTVFLIMMPALGRGMQNVYVGMHIREWPHINIMLPLYITELLIISMLLFAAWKFRKLKHPATYLAIGVNLFNLLLEPLGKLKTVQSFLEMIIKG
jgi:hypothetical protein